MSTMSILNSTSHSNTIPRWIVGGFVLVLISLYCFLPTYWNQQIFDRRLQQNQPVASQLHPDRRIIILYWTSFFGAKDFGVGFGSKPFSECGRVIASGCLTTADRGFLNDSDAVIFHVRDLNEKDLPPLTWRRPHQIFIFFLMESPVHTNMDMLSYPIFKNYFNRTMTYRRDSDVFNNAYGHIQCSVGLSASSSCLNFPQIDSSPTVIQEQFANPFDYTASSTNSFQINLVEKNRTVAWFVSNCKTNSKRESLVSKLSEFIPVDIYGKCGSGNHKCANTLECDQMLSRHYRFYLSFENSLCPDYLTEKLYRPLAHDTVPVVYGGSNYSFYLPHGSYINARDYKSPEDLANHLKRLMTDDRLYLSYFQWREKYTVDLFGEWCSLCWFLKEVNDRKENKTYDNIAAWWSGQTINRTCAVPPTSLVQLN